MTEFTPTNAAEAARQPNVLPMRELAVIGLFERAAGSVALLRLATGEIVRVGVGSFIGAAEIVAIDADGLHLMENGTLRSLTLPG